MERLGDSGDQRSRGSGDKRCVVHLSRRFLLVHDDLARLNAHKL